MAVSIASPVRELTGVGEKNEKLLAKLGVRTVTDLMFFLPRAHYDLTDVRRLSEVRDGEQVCVRAEVTSTPTLSRINGGMTLVRFRIEDGSGKSFVSYFNQPYMRSRFAVGDLLFFYGRATVDRYGVHFVNPQSEATPKYPILPVYPLTAGMTQRGVIKLIEQAIKSAGELPEMLLPEFREKQGLLPIAEAVVKAHFPPDMESLTQARRRLLYEELIMFSSAVASVDKKTRAAKIIDEEVEPFCSILPFEPTPAQVRVMWEISRDMGSGRAMNRLLQGDVGCGKTIVALYAMYITATARFQAAMMAPTEILARQHYETAKALFGPRFKIGLLTGGLNVVEKRRTLDGIRRGEIRMVFGTHALIYDQVEFHKLALIITDEQHRFGVKQREKLTFKTEQPHTLIMSATPIPRTLAMIIYGSAAISVIDQMPAGRIPVRTRVVPSGKRRDMYNFIRGEAEAGKSVFVVCPAIDKNADIPMKSVSELSAELSEIMGGVPMGVLHGRMKGADKDALISAFATGEIKVLISTTVVEVGVDIPRAQIMVVENAERFGLATLHQLRGRVGRGGGESWCFLVSDSASAAERLNVLVKSGDGFYIAEQDLKLRGPGEFMGQRQNGVADLYMRSLMTDIGLFEEIKRAYAEASEEQRAVIDADARLRFAREMTT